MNSDDRFEMPVSELGSGRTGRGRGCFFYGCLTAFCLILITVVGVSVVVVMGARQAVKFAIENSQDKPSGLPEVVSTDAEVDALNDRLKKFGEALENEKAEPPEPLELTELELNQLIQDEDELKGVVYVDFEPGEVLGKVSLPLDRFEWFSKDLKGRFLNGEGEFTVDITPQGLIDAHLQNLKLNDGKELPAQFKIQMRRENLAKDLNTDPDSSKLIKRLDRIEILKDKIRLIPRKKGGQQGVASLPAAKPTEEDFDKAVDDFKDEAKKP